MFIGIIQQKLDEDLDCIDYYCTLMGKPRGRSDPTCPHIGNIKSIFVNKFDARGPTYGRHLQHGLMRDEEFCLQTDSHMDVVQVSNTLSS